MIGDFNYKTNFPQKNLLIDRQASRLHKIFWNNLSPNVKLSKNQQFQQQMHGYMKNFKTGICLQQTILIISKEKLEHSQIS